MNIDFQDKPRGNVKKLNLVGIVIMPEVYAVVIDWGRGYGNRSIDYPDYSISCNRWLIRRTKLPYLWQQYFYCGRFRWSIVGIKWTSVSIWSTTLKRTVVVDWGYRIQSIDIYANPTVISFQMDDARSSLPRREECALHGGRCALSGRVRDYRIPVPYYGLDGLRTDTHNFF